MSETMIEEAVAPVEPPAPVPEANSFADATARAVERAQPTPSVEGVGHAAIETHETPVDPAVQQALDLIETRTREQAEAAADEQLAGLAGELGMESWQLKMLSEALADPDGFRERTTAELQREEQRETLAELDRASTAFETGDQQARELIASFEPVLGSLDADRVLAAAEEIWPQVERQLAELRLEYGPDIDSRVGDEQAVAQSVIRMAAEQVAEADHNQRLIDAELETLGRRYGRDWRDRDRAGATAAAADLFQRLMAQEPTLDPTETMRVTLDYVMRDELGEPPITSMSAGMSRVTEMYSGRMRRDRQATPHERDTASTPGSFSAAMRPASKAYRDSVEARKRGER